MGNALVVGLWLHFHTQRIQRMDTAIEMEKTLRIFKQEAYLDGYTDAREMIAKDIELAHKQMDCCQVAIAVCSCDMAIRIARGEWKVEPPIPWEEVKKELNI
jgi:hypothetical protein